MLSKPLSQYNVQLQLSSPSTDRLFVSFIRHGSQPRLDDVMSRSCRSSSRTSLPHPAEHCVDPTNLTRHSITHAALVNIPSWRRPSAMMAADSKPHTGWHDFCSRNAPQYGTKSVKTARWRIVCAMSCHLSRISYELFTKCVIPNVTHVHLPIST